MLVEGQWQRKWDPVQQQDSKGRFIDVRHRQNSLPGPWTNKNGTNSLLLRGVKKCRAIWWLSWALCLTKVKGQAGIISR